MIRTHHVFTRNSPYIVLKKNMDKYRMHCVFHGSQMTYKFDRFTKKSVTCLSSE